MFFSYKYTIIKLLLLTFLLTIVLCVETEEEIKCKKDILEMFGWEKPTITASECIKYAFNHFTQRMAIWNDEKHKYSHKYYHYLYQYIDEEDVRSPEEFCDKMKKILENSFGTTVKEVMARAQTHYQNLTNNTNALEREYLFIAKKENPAEVKTPAQYCDENKQLLENSFGNTAKSAVEHYYKNDSAIRDSNREAFKYQYMVHIFLKYKTKAISANNTMLEPNVYCERNHGISSQSYRNKQ